MKTLLQRVSQASVTVDGTIVGQIGHGALIFVGLEATDTEADMTYHLNKLMNLRCYADEAGKMNRTIQDVGGSFLVVSQFTLAGSCRKGNRPGFDKAMPPEQARQRFDQFVTDLRAQSGVPVETGQFGAHMQVALINDGPVTFLLASHQGQPLD